MLARVLCWATEGGLGVTGWRLCLLIYWYSVFVRVELIDMSYLKPCIGELLFAWSCRSFADRIESLPHGL